MILSMSMDAIDEIAWLTTVSVSIATSTAFNLCSPTGLLPAAPRRPCFEVTWVASLAAPSLCYKSSCLSKASLAVLQIRTLRIDRIAAPVFLHGSLLSECRRICPGCLPGRPAVRSKGMHAMRGVLRYDLGTPTHQSKDQELHECWKAMDTHPDLYLSWSCVTTSKQPYFQNLSGLSARRAK